MTTRRPLPIPVRATLLGLFCAACASGSTFTVDSTADQPDATPGNGQCRTVGNTCTLRAAIQEANAMAGHNLILVPPGTYVLTIAEPTDDGITGGDLDITDTLTVRGTGPAHTIIEAGGAFRVLDVDAGFVRLESLELRGGDADEGAGLRIAASSTVWGYTLDIHSNLALSLGAGIMNRGILILYESEVHDNHVSARGGGIKSSAGAATTLWNSTVHGNSANHGAGMHVDGETAVFNSTISGDSASYSGGGIFNAGNLRLANATIAFNRALGGTLADAGGVRNYDRGVVWLRNTIIGDNYALQAKAPDCAGTLQSEGWNLITSLSGCTVEGTTTGNITGQGAGLDPLAVYSPPVGTPTHRPRATSPAVDAGNPAIPSSTPPACWAKDQRGVVRVTCDIGAHERT